MMIAILVGAILGGIAGLGFGWLAYGRIPGFRAAEVMSALGGCACAGALTAATVHFLWLQDGLGWIRFPVAIFAGGVVFWLCGDLLHAVLMRRCYAKWNAAIPRDDGGVREGCREFAIGEGHCALVLIHGFADSPSVFQRMAPVLADRGFHCRAIRLPYHAMGMEHQQRTRVMDWRDAVHDELDAVRSLHERVIVVAHSMGAAIALNHVLDHAHHVDAIVMLTPLIEVCGTRSPFLPPHIWYRILDASLLFTDCVATWFASSLRDKNGDSLLKEDRFVPRTIYRALFEVLRDNRQRRNSFNKPLLMMLSRKDQTVDNAAAQTFFEDCASPSKRLVVVDDTSHVMPLDWAYERIVAEIVEFERGLG